MRQDFYRTPYLIELQCVQEVKELSVFLIVLQLDVVLLQPMQSQLRLVVHKDFHRLEQAGVVKG